MRSIIFLLAGVLLAAPVQAMQRYEAHYEQADWSVTTGPSRCEARQRIPRYGDVAFVQVAGSDLEFKVIAYHRPPQTQSVEIRTERPEWQGGDAVERLGALPLESESPTVHVAQGAALMLMLELEAGRMPVLTYADWTRPDRSIEVAVSPIRFLPAVAAFRECLAGLPPPVPLAALAPELRTEPEASAGVDDAGAATDEAGERAERRRELKYRILSGGPREEVRILLPSEAEAEASAEVTPAAEPAPGSPVGPETEAMATPDPAESVPQQNSAE